MSQEQITALLLEETIEPNRPEWYLTRHNMLTAADVASALDLNIYFSKLDLLKQKCLPLQQVSNPNLIWGNKYESIARSLYQKITGQQVQLKGLFKHPKYNWLGATPDGIVMCGKLLEIKCPFSRQINSNNIPYIYWIQMQIQMEVCNIDSCDFFQCKFQELEKMPSEHNFKYFGTLYNELGAKNWILSEYTLITVARDKEWFTINFPKLEEFWNMVLHYRNVGLDKLILELGKNQQYYNLETKQLVAIKESTTSGTNIQHQLNIPENFTMTVRDDLPENLVQINSPILKNLPSFIDIISPSLLPNIIIPSLPTRDDNIEFKTINPISPLNLDLNNSSNNASVILDVNNSSNNASQLEDWQEWVAATATFNYMHDDPLLDWLDHCYQRSGVIDQQSKTFFDQQSNHTSSRFLQHIQSQALIFENAVVSFLKSSYEVITIANSYEVRQKSKYEETLNAMHKGVPIIYQAVMYNYKQKLYGLADLLVRSDILENLFEISPIDKKQSKIGCKFHKHFHYVVIDIKFTTLRLRSDGIHLLNSGSNPAYKAQVYIYNECLGEMQDYKPSQSYILGKKYHYEKSRIQYTSQEWFKRAGVINFNSEDSLQVEKAKKAIQWIRRIREEGHTWSLNPPTVRELYPNMCNEMDTPWHSFKLTLAQQLQELTLLWQCGVANRQYAHAKNIFSLTDPNCTAKNLNIKGKKYEPIVDAILEVNNSPNKILPHQIDNTLYKYKVEFFVDFETMRDSVVDIDDYTTHNIPTTISKFLVYMIGVGYRVLQTDCLTGQTKYTPWEFECFTTPRINEAHELNLLIEFLEFLNETLFKYSAHDDFILYHWSHAEPSIYAKLIEKYFKSVSRLIDRVNIHWVDLLKFFQDNRIVIKGAYNYSLKSIAKAACDQCLIQTQWVDVNVVDGLDAMILAMQADTEAKKLNIDITDTLIMKQIQKYNEIDCRVMSELIDYVRDNMLKPKKRKTK